MLDFRLNKQELAELRAAHRRALNVREAYRINAVILLGNGRTVADIADTLLFDPDTVRAYFKRYKKGGLEALLRMNYAGSEALLDGIQFAVLETHLQEHLHLTAGSVARWVKICWGVCYSPSGMAAVLRRLGYVYKKPKLVRERRMPPPKRRSSKITKTSSKTAMRMIWSCSWAPPIRSTIQ